MGYLFVSGWMREPGPGGISQYSFNSDTGEIKKIRTICEDISFNVSYLDEKHSILYALSETADLPSLRFGGGGSVYGFHLDRETGNISSVEINPLYSANPCNLTLDAEGKVEQQGLCMHPSGLYLYDVINGPNQIAVFRIDQTDGSLTLIQNQPAGYEWPRGAALSPDGKFLAVACVRGQKVVTFRIGDDGMLTPTGFACDQPNAAYATFWDA